MMDFSFFYLISCL